MAFNLKLSSLIIASLISTNVSAAIVEETYTGTVTGTDTLGLFGADNASLHTTFVSNYFFDTSIGPSSSVGQFQVFGGAVVSAPTPSLGATLIINGVPYFTNGGYTGLLIAYNSNNVSYRFGTQSQADDFGGKYLANFVVSELLNVPFPTSLASPFTYSVQVGDFVGGELSIPGELLDLTPTSVTLADAVPEPSTWTMLLLGFAGIGLLRYRVSLKARSGPVLITADL